MGQILTVVLSLLWLVQFGLSLGLTLLSFQAYQRNKSKRLETAFIGFAFISMAVGLTALLIQTGVDSKLLQIAEVIPFIIGFAMLYVSLYRPPD